MMRRLGLLTRRRMLSTQVHIETPLMLSKPLSAKLEKNVYLKLDCIQPSGSFKLRGIGRSVAAAHSAGVQAVVSSSGGNAGLATAYAAEQLGLACTVVLPMSTPKFVADRLRSYNAEVMVHGMVWDQANEKAMEIVEEVGGALIHPFEGEETWKGHATIIEESQRQLPPGVVPDAVVTCVGGGGLLMGILQGVDQARWPSKVVAAETVGASSLYTSLQCGELVTLDGINSVAKSLGAQRVSEKVFEACRTKTADEFESVVVTDAEAVSACLAFAEDHRLLVEPACGAALATLYNMPHHEALRGAETVLVEVCGGAIVDVDMLNMWADELSMQRPNSAMMP